MKQVHIFALIGVFALLVVAGILVFTSIKSPGSSVVFSNFDTISVSGPIPYGQPPVDAFAINAVISNRGADTYSANIYPGANGYTGKTVVTMRASKASGSFEYRLTEPPAGSNYFYGIDLQSRCGPEFNAFGTCGGKTFQQFSSACKATTSTGVAMVADVGTLGYPAFVCYVYKPHYAFGVFDAQSVGYQPVLDIIVEPNMSNDTIAYARLTATNPQVSLVDRNGIKIGESKIVGFMQGFESTPSPTSIIGIRPIGSTSYNLIVPTTVKDLYSNDKTILEGCLRNIATIQSSSSPNLPFIPSDWSMKLSGTTNEGNLTSCVNQFNANIDVMQYIAPAGIFGQTDLVDTTSLASTGKLYLKDQNFLMPDTTTWIYASSVGVYRQQTIPASPSCSDTTLNGGNAGAVQASVKNTGSDGLIQWAFTCNGGVSATPPSGGVNALGSGATTTFTILVSTGTTQSVNTCNLTVKDQDNANPVSTTCTVTQKAICTGSPTKQGFVFDANCTEVCLLQPTQCQPPQTAMTPATGYPNSCTCSGAPNSTGCADGTAIGACNAANNRCISVSVGSSSGAALVPDASCGNGGNTSCVAPSVLVNGVCTTPQVCLPIVQTAIQPNPGFMLFGFQLTPGTPGSCVYDPVGIGGILAFVGLLVALAGVFGKKKDAVFIGAAILVVGFVSMGFGFIAGNALVSTIGAIFIVVMVVLAILAYVLVKIGKYV